MARGTLAQWCTNVIGSKVEPLKEVARLIRNHFQRIVVGAQTRQTNGVLEALNGLFQAATRNACGYGQFCTIRTVIFPIAEKWTSPLQPGCRLTHSKFKCAKHLHQGRAHGE